MLSKVKKFERKLTIWSIDLIKRLMLLRILIPVQDPLNKVWLVGRDKFEDLLKEGVIKWEEATSLNSETK